MNRLVEKIIKHLYKQNNFQILEIEDFKYKEINMPLILAYDMAMNELYICTLLDSNDLKLTNLKLQVSLNEFLKIKQENLLVNIENNVYDFEKNATLIIFTNERSSETLKKGIEIEEDPYFFKKHVLILNENEVQVLENEYGKHQDNFHSKLESTINNLELFKQFSINEISENATLYGVVAKLYEKLPFLVLPVNEFSNIKLLDEIDKELKLKELFELKSNLLKCSNNVEIETWIEGLLNEREND